MMPFPIKLAAFSLATPESGKTCSRKASFIEKRKGRLGRWSQSMSWQMSPKTFSLQKSPKKSRLHFRVCRYLQRRVLCLYERPRPNLLVILGLPIFENPEIRNSADVYGDKHECTERGYSVQGMASAGESEAMRRAQSMPRLSDVKGEATAETLRQTSHPSPVKSTKRGDVDAPQLWKYSRSRPTFFSREPQ